MKKILSIIVLAALTLGTEVEAVAVELGSAMPARAEVKNSPQKMIGESQDKAIESLNEARDPRNVAIESPNKEFESQDKVIEKQDTIRTTYITAVREKMKNTTQTGLMRISSKTLRAGYAVMGTPDVIKTLQTLPGVAAGNELM